MGYGDRVEFFRKRLGLTQKELARQVRDVSQSEISQIEQDNARATPHQKEILSEALGVPRRILFCERSPKGASVPVEVLMIAHELLPVHEQRRLVDEAITRVATVEAWTKVRKLSANPKS